jgi:hypothetical protein
MILELLGYACLMVLLMNFEYYQKLLTFLYLDIKPFTCTLCMSFWTSVTPLVISYGLKGILYSGIVSVTAELLDRKINTL